MTHPYWQRLGIARHEASHAIGAQAMGLKVAWVSIEDVMSDGEIYKAATGIEIEGHEGDEMKVAMHLDLSDHPKLLEVCVTTAMPAFTTIPSNSLYQYSVLEYRQAIQMAEKGGISAEEIDYRCDGIQDERWSDILDLARQLVHYGRVEF